MNDHAHYEELTALAAGGDLSEQEWGVLREHLAACAECRRDEAQLRSLVRSGLPLTQGDFTGFVDKMKVRPDAGARERFLQRARREGVRFSSVVDKPVSAPWLHRGFRSAIGAVIAAAILVAVFYGPNIFRRATSETQAVQEANRLKSENAALGARLAGRDQEVATQQNQIRDLRSQLGNAIKSAEGYRRDNEQKGVRLDQSTSHEAELLDELQNREAKLTAAADEVARINQLRATDQVSLVTQRARIREISDQLRIADATVDMERQLAVAGKDIRALLVARQLHVVDVRDTDAEGKPSQAFGRVFLTEGKSLMFFAFDLNDSKAIDLKARFQVWGEQLGKQGSLRSLGALSVDDKAQNRWALEVENPDLLNEINSVFVTVSYPGGGSSGPRLLYAYIGAPNHS
jgi:regulator of replication initiation timing